MLRMLRATSEDLSMLNSAIRFRLTAVMVLKNRGTKIAHHSVNRAPKSDH